MTDGRESGRLIPRWTLSREVVEIEKAAGMLACVTKKSNDKGVDGFALHPEGFIVVQCKRYAPEYPVGRPLVQRFWGAIEENED